jgi:tripartite-type tricarboxylate transporter receptor subunit TctC
MIVRGAVAATLFAAAALIAETAYPQTYPSRPVTIIVPSPPGGGTDTIARLIGDQLARQFGQPFVIENRAGAGLLTGPRPRPTPRRTVIRCWSALTATWP